MVRGKALDVGAGPMLAWRTLERNKIKKRNRERGLNTDSWHWFNANGPCDRRHRQPVSAEMEGMVHMYQHRRDVPSALNQRALSGGSLAEGEDGGDGKSRAR
jgi:hypothetical protein